ncbi:MAG: DegV family protein [Enterocloster sp.]
MVQIITDSSTLYTADEARRAGFEAVPLCVHIGETEGRDLQIDMKEYYEKIRQGQVPRSSQPPIGDVVEVYESYPEKDIINIAMADGLSGTYQSACSAGRMAKNSHRIAVFNSRTLCGPHRYMVERAQRMKEEGKTAGEILRWLEQAARKTESFLIPQDFSFLKRGGRLTPVAAALGSVLKLKPVMKLTEDGTRLDKFLVKRTMSAAVKGIIEHLKEKKLGAEHILYISHADALADAQAIRRQFEEIFEGLEVQILELSPVFVAQGGPKCVAIQYIER